MSNINPASSRPGPRSDGTFGVVASTHGSAPRWAWAPGARAATPSMRASPRHSRCRWWSRTCAPRRRRAGDAVRGEQHEAESSSCGHRSGTGRRHHRALSRPLGLDIVPGTGLLPGLHSPPSKPLCVAAHTHERLRDVLEAAIGTRRTVIRWSSAPRQPSAQSPIFYRKHWPTVAAVYSAHGNVPAPRQNVHQQAARRDLQRILKQRKPVAAGARPRSRGHSRIWSQGFRFGSHRRVRPHHRVMDVSGRPHKGVLTAQDMRPGCPPSLTRCISISAAIRCCSRTPGRRSCAAADAGTG